MSSQIIHLLLIIVGPGMDVSKAMLKAMKKAKKEKRKAAKKGAETKAKNKKSSSMGKSSTAIIAKPSMAAVASKPSGLKKAPPAAVVPYEFSVRNNHLGAYLFIVVIIIVDSLLSLNPLFVVNYICRC